MSTHPPSCPSGHEQELTPDQLNLLTGEEAYVYALLAWHAATQRPVTLQELAEVQDPQDEPLGTDRARQAVDTLHVRGLLIIGQWDTAHESTPLRVRLSHQRLPSRRPRVLDPQATPVGGGFHAPPTLDAELTRELRDTGRRIAELHAAPVSERTSGWGYELADLTERRAALFQRWARLQASGRLTREVLRLATAAAQLRTQADLTARRERQGGTVRGGEDASERPAGTP